MTETQTLQQCKTLLERHYQGRFKGLVLYGSCARGEATRESDIDLLVLLEGAFDDGQELRAIIETLYPVQLETAQLISAKPARLADFERGAGALYRNAKREGVWVGEEAANFRCAQSEPGFQ